MTEWQPIESAPKDGRRVLLIDANDGNAQACWGEWCEWDDGSWRDIGDIGCNGQWSYEPTHWMPLPAPPPPPKGSIKFDQWKNSPSVGR